jgi:hypothetical protein
VEPLQEIDRSYKIERWAAVIDLVRFLAQIVTKCFMWKLLESDPAGRVFKVAAGPVHRQEGLPFDDGVVSGMAMTTSSSPAVATIARVRKAAL